MELRQLVWAVVAVLLVYGVWQVFRALAAGNRSGRAAPAAVPDDQPAAVVDDEHDDLDLDYAPLPSAVDEQPAPPPAVSPVPADERADLFALELELQRVRRELAALRAAFDAHKEESAVLHEAIARLEARPIEMVARPEEALEQSASPEYSEALVLARRGGSVDEISARCGITRAEAELVVSLAGQGDAGART